MEKSLEWHYRVMCINLFIFWIFKLVPDSRLYCVWKISVVYDGFVGGNTSRLYCMWVGGDNNNSLRYMTILVVCVIWVMCIVSVDIILIIEKVKLLVYSFRNVMTNKCIWCDLLISYWLYPPEEWVVINKGQ